MADRHDELTLPNAVVTRLIKDVLPDGVAIAKEARTAFSKAASVFVLYVTSQSNSVALKNNRKTITGQDVLVAMEDMEFEKFVEPLEKSLSNFKRAQREKKEATAKRKQQNKEDTNKKGDNTTGEEEELVDEKENDIETIEDD